MMPQIIEELNFGKLIAESSSVTFLKKILAYSIFHYTTHCFIILNKNIMKKFAIAFIAILALTSCGKTEAPAPTVDAGTGTVVTSTGTTSTSTGEVK
jgi:hypothetical protein